MDNQRLIVWAAFGLLAFMTYQTWLLDYGSEPVSPEVAPAVEAGGEAGAPAETTPTLPALPSAESDMPVLEEAGPGAPVAAADSVPVTTGQTVTVTTDVFEIEISTAGGVLTQAMLKEYPIAKDQPDTLVELLSLQRDRYATLHSGLIADDSDGEPYFNANLTAEAARYALDGADEIAVPLTWTNDSGITITKTFRFTRGSYQINVEHLVSNSGDSPWRAADFTILRRKGGAAERSMFNVDTYSFDGPQVYDGQKSEKHEYEDLLTQPVQINASGGWVAGIEHHFLRAIVPPTGVESRLDVAARDGQTTASVFGPATTVAPGAAHTFETRLFVGPKLQSQLEEIDPSLKLTVDYGFLTILSNPLFWLLSKIYSLVGNWGLAIILVTVLIKAAFYKLTEKSGRSMAKMREIQPRMKALQERYKDDRQQLGQATMELYKREKVNPAAGCLPILIQMPFFLAFYWVLLESVEMRQAPFALWITDLSSRDPYFILPIIMGAAMLFQQKLNPAPADPVQAKVMQIMPVIFTGFFAFFPSGLVLYWVTNTLLSIAQQWYVNKIVEEESRARKGKDKGKKKQKGAKKDS